MLFILLPQSHVIIAQEIHRHISDIYGIELNKEQLILGSIMPDIYSGLPKLKHFKPQSLDIIGDKICYLSLRGFDYGRLSVDIGMVTHYVADYFCHPHNDRATYKGQFLKHILYEKELHQRYLDLPEISSGLDRGIDFTRHSQVVHYIDSMHHTYSARAQCYDNDVHHSVKASIAVASLIVREACLSRINPPVTLPAPRAFAV